MDHPKNIMKTDNSKKKDSTNMVHKMEYGNPTTKTENSDITKNINESTRNQSVTVE